MTSTPALRELRKQHGFISHRHRLRHSPPRPGAGARPRRRAHRPSARGSPGIQTPTRSSTPSATRCSARRSSEISASIFPKRPEWKDAPSARILERVAGMVGRRRLPTRERRLHRERRGAEDRAASRGDGPRDGECPRGRSRARLRQGDDGRGARAGRRAARASRRRRSFSSSGSGTRRLSVAAGGR